VWSVWSESLELYLGQGLVMLKKDGIERVIAHPATLPFGQVLAKITEAVAREQTLKKAKHCKLRVTLSGALCPAVTFSAPQEVRRWDELRSIAQASTAMGMEVGPDQIFCEMDIARRGLASGLTVSLMQLLQDWATQQRFHLVSMRPLWAVASQCTVARQPDVLGLIVQEPDATTLLVEVAGGKFAATTLTGLEDQLPMLARRWLVSQGVADEKLLKLRFAVPSRPVLPQGPKAWPTHWDSP